MSSLRHHNWGFPTAPRDAIFVLSTTTHKALEDVGLSKASLRFALDLALKAPSPLSADIVSDTIELCDLVRTMYSARYSPTWFSGNIKKTRESRPRSRRVEFNSSASDRSVEARHPRHRDEPTSGRGKSKRVMTVLTTNSDTGPGSPGTSDPGNRPPRQVTPCVFYAPDPLGSAPSFPPGNESPHLRPETRPTLRAPMPHEIHLSGGSSNPQLTPQSLEMITAGSIAALNQHLAATSPNRNMRRFGRQDAVSGVLNVSPTHSRRDPFAADCGVWPFDGRDYDIVCTVTNNILNTDWSCGRHSSPRTHVVRLAYSIRVAVATVARPNIAFAGARPPSEIHSHSLIPSLEHTTLMDPSLKHGNYE